MDRQKLTKYLGVIGYWICKWQLKDGLLALIPYDLAKDGRLTGALARQKLHICLQTQCRGLVLLRTKMWVLSPASVKLHVSIGKYWVSLYVLACMVVCIMERIGMYWHGMYYGMYWYVLFLVCITCIGKYWYVFRGHMCKYSYVLVSIGMYRKMVCIVHIGMY